MWGEFFVSLMKAVTTMNPELILETIRFLRILADLSTAQAEADKAQADVNEAVARLQASKAKVAGINANSGPLNVTTSNGE